MPEVEEADGLDAFLAEARRKAEGGSAPTVKIRTLVRRAGAGRRGRWVVDSIQRALDRHGLVSDPSFASGWIDNHVVLRLASPADPSTRAEQAVAPRPSSSEIFLTVGTLESANTGVVSLERTQDIELARALMLRHDFSQLAVLSGPRQLVGAVSWESIAKASIAQASVTLADAIVPALHVQRTAPLLPLIGTIVERGFVFVEGRDRSIIGIVTTADLSERFASLANPFFLLGEIERRLRGIISTSFSAEEVTAARDGRDADRTVESADDLTVGEMVRLFESAERWARLGWSVDRGAFVKTLDEVREVRNDVMHFNPDPLASEQLQLLHNFVSWLRTLDPRT